MPLYYIVILALVQGVTEFLPVSSSGHLAALPLLSGIQDQGLTLDVAVHVGTLVAVIIFFWRDVLLALRGTVSLAQGHTDAPGATLAWCLMVATVPVILVGLVLHLTQGIEHLRSLKVIGWAMFGFGLVLYWADRSGPTDKTAGDWTASSAWRMGLAQAIAMIPGTSRSGITITAARMLGYGREDAARLAMLMSIPTIIASGVLLAAQAAADADLQILKDGALAAALSCIAALFALSIMMRLLKSVSFTPYVIYRVLFGGALLIWAYS